jgi:hypothetical protein
MFFYFNALSDWIFLFDIIVHFFASYIEQSTGDEVF